MYLKDTLESTNKALEKISVRFDKECTNFIPQHESNLPRETGTVRSRPGNMLNATTILAGNESIQTLSCSIATFASPIQPSLRQARKLPLQLRKVSIKSYELQPRQA